MSGTLTFYTGTLTYWSEAIHNNYINLHLYFDGVILKTFCKFSPLQCIRDFEKKYREFDMQVGMLCVRDFEKKYRKFAM